ncbi:MAG TPA: SH3 domain-containing protein [Verrucomicrobiae bacterium]|nr:SH3 domain-containing protein [Verrucomicrobiae bacterium]
MPVRIRNLVIAVVVVTVIGAGVLIGKQVGAAGVDPGSQGDPLVAKSYVDSKIANILDRLTKLESDVAEIKSTLSKTPAPSTPSTPSNPTTPAPTVKKGTVSGAWVNIRSGPGTGYSKVTTVGKGTVGEVLGSDSGWYKIKLGNGTVGWIAGWLFTVQ